ncbi:MAG: PD-(D/E)XK nuclease family protein [Cetobacterium sp.]|uniref:PD-(D/E)XK nuclease family protein n=1 Tax=Cetobacterium sp. TaxID=2071632 RepID=UPI003F330677
MNNIFDFAPKELVLDAFLCWCFNFHKSENKIEKEFSHNLIQEIYNYCGGNKILNIEKVTPLTQYGKSKIDVLVEILLKNHEKLYFVFENKLETSHHSNQINRHIEEMEQKNKDPKEEIKYIYFKIGNLYDEDRNLPEKFTLLDRKSILKIFDKIKVKSEIFDFYCNFLFKIEERNNLEKLLIEKDMQLTKKELDIIFWSPSGQYKILKKLSDKIKSIISRGTSFGRPWTNIQLLSRETNKIWYGIFWRIDWRMNKKTNTYTPYICLRYYKTSLEKTSEDDIYFDGMRKIFNELASKYSNLEFGKVHNIGNKEREIGILYFDNEKNTIPKVINEIGKFSEEFLIKVKEKELYYKDAKYYIEI